MFKKILLLLFVTVLVFNLSACSKATGTDSQTPKIDSGAIYDETFFSLMDGFSAAKWNEYAQDPNMAGWWKMDYANSKLYAENQLCSLISSDAPYDELVSQIESDVVYNTPTAKAMIAAATKAYCPKY